MELDPQAMRADLIKALETLKANPVRDVASFLAGRLAGSDPQVAQLFVEVARPMRRQ